MEQVSFGAGVTQLRCSLISKHLFQLRFLCVHVSRLSFANLSVSDSGLYACTATNRAGNDSSSFTLTVAG